jgi:hypothetical protein
VDLRGLKHNPALQHKLRNEVLLRNLDHIEEYVEYGVAPLFGYPPICFSPKHVSDYWKIVMKPVM